MEFLEGFLEGFSKPFRWVGWGRTRMIQQLSGCTEFTASPRSCRCKMSQSVIYARGQKIWPLCTFAPPCAALGEHLSIGRLYQPHSDANPLPPEIAGGNLDASHGQNDVASPKDLDRLAGFAGCSAGNSIACFPHASQTTSSVFLMGIPDAVSGSSVPGYQRKPAQLLFRL